ncbi:MAG TPA: F0F1 ATP synthase subunit delta [Patescibacteria group bacterium]|jgi:F0F1-type ATP synthase delta subunit|nr:F0F1 ATP synthase subunit delta [Patescibacteria group bacterium]
MKKSSRRALARTILRLLQDQPTRRSQILRSVGAYLINSKQTRQSHLLIGDIARALEPKGYLYTEVSSAYALDDASRGNLSAFLKNQTGASTVELDERVDPTLLSGVIIRTPDKELDTSAKRKLRRLASLSSRGDS